MRWRSGAGIGVLAGIVAAAILVVPAGGGGTTPTPDTSLLRSAAAWNGLVGGERAPVGIGQRVLVVLTAFSLADRVQRAGGVASDADERRWTSTAAAAQQQFISNLAAAGVSIRPEFRYTRTLNGFSAVLDPRAIALIERTPGVKGVYPVRVAFPASLSPRELRAAAAGAARPGVRLAGIAGRGVTIALLDTGVDLATPYLHGHVLSGIDIAGDGRDAQAQAKPAASSVVESHGTEMAGLLVGDGGPGGVAGVAPAATVLPIRVAGWQPDAKGGYTVYSRTDQLLAGLERAVDPDGNGDAHDAARVALVPLVEPFAAFTDGPLARAVEGATRLDTLVVAAAGNDGPAGPAFGSVGGPAGAPDALAVGAADSGRTLTQVRVVVRTGLRILLDRLVPLAGGAAPARTLELTAAVPGRSGFLQDGLSRVAGRAAVAPAGDDPAATARGAADAGAAAVVLYGRPVAAAMDVDPRVGVPVISLPEAAAHALATDPRAEVVLAAPRRSAAAPAAAAPFSSWGLAFDGGIKPDLLAPGVGLATAEPGAAGDGGSLFGTVTGSSAAAAVVAGAAALLAEARPDARAATLRALLVGGARPIERTPAAAEGAGLLDVGHAAALELVADPPLLTFGRGTREGWRGDAVARVRNLSSRPLTVYLSAGGKAGAALRLTVTPRRAVIPPGEVERITVHAPPITIAEGEAALGSLAITPLTGAAIHVPWAVVLRPARALLGPLLLSRGAFKPSESQPAIVVVPVGRVLRSAGGNTVVPVLRLDLELWTDKGKRLGLLTRLRDLLPGRYAIGLTGHDPGGKVLRPGKYRLRVFAWPTGGGAPTVRSIPFRIE
ncbi:MAG TPA: S8 family serine peptidase [Gaiellaceae bacterium]|nr:S8 family serine peptidase [Gaiellaceae bacterium]